jgi:hypothetical protein
MLKSVTVGAECDKVFVGKVTVITIGMMDG